MVFKKKIMIRPETIFNLGNVEVAPGMSARVSKAVSTSFKVERVGFSKVAKDLLFNMWVNGHFCAELRVLGVGDVVCLELINRSGSVFETNLWISGR
jgi:hypothetical protein